MKNSKKNGRAYLKLAVGAAAIVAGSLIGAHVSGDLPKMRSGIESLYETLFSASTPAAPAQVPAKQDVASIDAGLQQLIKRDIPIGGAVECRGTWNISEWDLTLARGCRIDENLFSQYLLAMGGKEVLERIEREQELADTRLNRSRVYGSSSVRECVIHFNSLQISPFQLEEILAEFSCMRDHDKKDCSAILIKDFLSYRSRDIDVESLLTKYLAIDDALGAPSDPHHTLLYVALGATPKIIKNCRNAGLEFPKDEALLEDVLRGTTSIDDISKYGKARSMLVALWLFREDLSPKKPSESQTDEYAKYIRANWDRSSAENLVLSGVPFEYAVAVRESSQKHGIALEDKGVTRLYTSGWTIEQIEKKFKEESWTRVFKGK